MNLLDTIRKAIEADKRTQYRISKETGIAPSQLSRTVRGISKMDVETIEKLADCLGLQIIVRPKRGAKKGR